MLSSVLFKKIDNAPLIIFRVFFGLLMVAECWGAIATGWVKETFVDPSFTFNFIGFDWTQTLVSAPPINFGFFTLDLMYVVFFVLGCFGWCIAFGFKYRWVSIFFAIGWSLVYFMQKSHYNNHYYLVVLIAWFMVFVPANKSFSLDAKFKPEIKTDTMNNWVRLFMIVQIAIVYFFAAVAKLYPGWWEGKFLILRLERSAQWFREELGWKGFSNFLANDDFAKFLSWSGIAFDFLFVPFLMFKSTRKLAFFGALLFHLFNSITLHIGIFPYFALALAVFFYPTKTIRNIFFRKKEIDLRFNPPILPNWKKSLISVGFIVYFIWQTYLPLRHWHIPEDVLWTEEGHRLSWRMMLRTKGAATRFYIEDKETGKREPISIMKYVSKNQAGDVRAKPDMIWQLAQKLKKIHAEDGKDVGVYVKSKLSINGGPYFDYIDDNVDITEVKWNYWGHQNWILPGPDNYFKKSDKIPLEKIQTNQSTF